MKITVDVPDNEIAERAKEIVSEYVAKRMIDTLYTPDSQFYRRTTKEVIRETIKADKNELEARAVSAAMKSIKTSAVKTLLGELKEG